jgi:hypothetical protein
VLGRTESRLFSDQSSSTLGPRFVFEQAFNITLHVLNFRFDTRFASLLATGSGRETEVWGRLGVPGGERVQLLIRTLNWIRRMHVSAWNGFYSCQETNQPRCLHSGYDLILHVDYVHNCHGKPRSLGLCPYIASLQACKRRRILTIPP